MQKGNMANSIFTQRFGAVIPATIEKNAPVLQYVNKTLSGKLGPGSGSTVDVLRPQYNRVSEGESWQALTGAGNAAQNVAAIADLGVNTDNIAVKVKVRKVGGSIGIIDRTLNLTSEDLQLIQPFYTAMAHYVNGSVFASAFCGAQSSFVGNVNGQALAQAAGVVGKSVVGGKKWGMLDPIVMKTIAADPSFRWFEGALSRQNYNGLLGNYSGVEYFESPDTVTISLSLGSSAQNTFSISGTCGIVNDGDTSLALTITAATNDAVSQGLTVIPKGTPFIIGTGNVNQDGLYASNFKVADVLNRNTVQIRTFICQNDTAIVSGGVTNVPVGPINLISEVNGVITPTSAAIPSAYYKGPAQTGTQAFFCPLKTGANYFASIVSCENATAFASAPPAPAASTDSVTTTIEGALNVRMTYSWITLESQNIFSLYSLFGAQACYGQGSVAIYALVA